MIIDNHVNPSVIGRNNSEDSNIDLNIDDNGYYLAMGATGLGALFLELGSSVACWSYYYNNFEYKFFI